MSHRKVLTISDDHFAWLEEIRKERGLNNIQGAIRSVLEDNYLLDKKSKSNMPNVDIRRVKKRMRNLT